MISIVNVQRIVVLNELGRLGRVINSLIIGLSCSMSSSSANYSLRVAASLIGLLQDDIILV